MRRFGRPVQPVRNAGPASFRPRTARSGVTLPQINHASMLDPNERQQNNPMAGLATPQNMKTMGMLGDLFKSSPVDNDAARSAANASPNGPGAGYSFGGGDPMADSIQNNSALVAPKGVAPVWGAGSAGSAGYTGLQLGSAGSGLSGIGSAGFSTGGAGSAGYTGLQLGGASGAKGAASAGVGGAASALPFIGAAYMGLDALGVRNQQGENPMFSGAGILGYGPQGSVTNTVLDPDNLLGGIFGFGGGKGLGGILGF